MEEGNRAMEASLWMLCMEREEDRDENLAIVVLRVAMKVSGG